LHRTEPAAIPTQCHANLATSPKAASARIERATLTGSRLQTGVFVHASHSPKAGELRLELRAQVLETCRLPLTSSPECRREDSNFRRPQRTAWSTAKCNCRYA